MGFSTQYIQIPYQEAYYFEAEQEIAKRRPFMFTKFQDTASRRAGQLRGMVVEKHVSGWFKDKWPEHYLEADNFQKWEEHCAHDFKLQTAGGLYLIDVSGPKKDGSFGSYAMKPAGGVDYHLICEVSSFKTWQEVDFTKGFRLICAFEAQHFSKKLDRKWAIPMKEWLQSIQLPI